MLVGWIIERNREIGSTAGAVSPDNGFAREIVAGNVEDAAPARHQREQIGVRLLRSHFARNFICKGCGGDEKQGGEDLPV